MKRPLIFGEVLFDIFPDGQSVLGGAPFNVAWNLQALGLRPLFVSAVGDDEKADQVKATMSSAGMDTDGLQVVADRPTGRVTVSLHDGQPEYIIEADQAYDAISCGFCSDLQDSFSLMYHGSLICRSKQSRATLRKLIMETSVPRFVDVNIREPHFDSQWLHELLPGAAWVKMNDVELSQLTGIAVNEKPDVAAGVKVLKRSFGPATYIVTCGSRGAYAVTEDAVSYSPSVPPREIVDTVGAGDAFAAAAIHGIMHQNSIQETLDSAVALASRICETAGATADFSTIR